MSRPDVVLVTPFPPPGVTHAGATGVASYSANLAAALVDEGANVAVVAPGKDPADDLPRPRGTSGGWDDRAPRMSVRRDMGDGAWAVAGALRAARETGAPVVHLQHELFLWGGVQGAPALLSSLGLSRRGGRGRRGRSALVVTMHQVVNPRDVDRAYTRMHRVAAPPLLARTGLANLQNAVARLADQTIVHEAAFRKVIDRAVVIPHGVEQVAVPDRRESRHRLGTRDGTLTVLCFGFVAPYKGLQLACEAATLAGDRVRLVVAGGDHPRMTGAGSYGDMLRSRYGDRVRFTGYVPEDEVGPWFAAADLALLPYPRPHASSGALALAFAYGTPALLSPALADCVDAPAAMVAADTAPGLADQLVRYLREPSALERLRTVSTGLADERSWPVVARRHLSVYEEVARAQDPARRRIRSA